MPEFHSTFVGELAVGNHHEAHQGMCVCDPFGPRLCPRRSNLRIRAGGSRALGCWGRSANRRLGPAPQRTLLDRVDGCARGGLVSRLGPSFPRPRNCVAAFVAPRHPSGLFLVCAALRLTDGQCFVLGWRLRTAEVGRAWLPANVELTELIVVPGLQCQPYSAFVDLQLGDVLFLALMADAVGIWVSDVPSLHGEEAQ